MFWWASLVCTGEHCNLLQGNYLHCPPHTTITAMLLFPNKIMHSSLLKGISLRIGSDMSILPWRLGDQQVIFHCHFKASSSTAWHNEQALLLKPDSWPSSFWWLCPIALLSWGSCTYSSHSSWRPQNSCHPLSRVPAKRKMTNGGRIFVRSQKWEFPRE